MPDLLTVFFLDQVHDPAAALLREYRIGSDGDRVCCLVYLTILWTQSIPIGTRPLLTFGVLLVVLGGQTVFTGPARGSHREH